MIESYPLCSLHPLCSLPLFYPVLCLQSSSFYSSPCFLLLTLFLSLVVPLQSSTVLSSSLYLLPTSPLSFSPSILLLLLNKGTLQSIVPKFRIVKESNFLLHDSYEYMIMIRITEDVFCFGTLILR
uniref:Uncharacterized protein n=1 Tax=Cacopsylla melanoneura TaxID=428564 RepID=A0A8D9BUG7_9HEMI